MRLKGAGTGSLLVLFFLMVGEKNKTAIRVQVPREISARLSNALLMETPHYELPSSGSVWLFLRSEMGKLHPKPVAHGSAVEGVRQSLFYIKVMAYRCCTQNVLALAGRGLVSILLTGESPSYRTLGRDTARPAGSDSDTTGTHMGRVILEDLRRSATWLCFGFKKKKRRKIRVFGSSIVRLAYTGVIHVLATMSQVHGQH